MKYVPQLRAATRSPFLQVIKTSIATIIAWVVCALLLGQPLPIFAAIAALLVVQPSVNQSLTKGIERSVGVVAGVVIAFVIGQFLGNGSALVLAVIVIALVIAWALRLGPGSANQIPISAMLVLALGAQTPLYALDRIIETVVGAAVALAVNIAIVPPVALRPAHLAVGRLTDETALTLDELSSALREPRTPEQLAAMLERARGLRGLRDAANLALAQGAESLTLNPRQGKLRRVLEQDRMLADRLSVLVTRVLGMARAVHDRWDDTLASEPTVASIALELERAAHDLRLIGADTDGSDPNPVTAELPALTSPLAIARPHPDHWILIGSLLEDIRRVREEIVGAPDTV